MKLYRTLLTNHPLVNILFAVVVLMGGLVNFIPVNNPSAHQDQLFTRILPISSENFFFLDGSDEKAIFQ